MVSMGVESLSLVIQYGAVAKQLSEYLVRCLYVQYWADSCRKSYGKRVVEQSYFEVGPHVCFEKGSYKLSVNVSIWVLRMMLC